MRLKWPETTNPILTNAMKSKKNSWALAEFVEGNNWLESHLQYYIADRLKKTSKQIRLQDIAWRVLVF